MANKVILCWRAKTPRGWRHFPVLFHKQHGKTLPRHGWVIDDGKEVEYPEGHYELRSYRAGKMVYERLEGTHPAEAQWALQRAQREAQTKRTQKADPLHFIQGAIDHYLRDLEQRKKAEMLEKSTHVLSEFKSFCVEPSAHGKLPTTIHTRKITREHILGFHAWLRKHGNSERTIADKHQRVKAWLRFCKIDTSFMPPVPKYERKKVTVYTPSEIGAVRAAADPYMRMVIDLALKLGLREREISHAEWGDLDKHHGTFRVQAKVREDWRFSPKDSEQRDIPVPTDLLKSLKQWHEAHPETVLIVGNDEDKPEGHLLRKLKTLVRNAGLNCGKCEGCLREGSSAECERWFLHRFRSTYLTKIVRKMDLESARKFAGHSDIQTTQIYLEAADAASPETRKAINAIRWE